MRNCYKVDFVLILMIKERKGELTSTQIIMIVLAIAGFVIVLGIFYLFDFGSYGEKDSCRLSVLTRATVGGVAKTAQSAVPLKCTTEKICLTDRIFGKCEQFAGEKNVKIIKLKGSEKDKRTKIEEVSANAMYDCWSMMGEGKLDLFYNAAELIGLSKTDSTCVICSRIAIDEDVKLDLDKININEYMRTHNVPGKDETYLELFSGQKGVRSYAKVNEKTLSEKDLKDNIKPVNLKVSSTKENREMAFVFMQIKSEKISEVLENMAIVGGAAAVTAVSTPGVGFILKKAVATAGGWVTLGVVTVAAAAIGGYGTYNAYQGQLAAKTYCGKFASGDSGAKGCSIVQGVNYNPVDINKMCASIQGNP